MSTFKYTSCVNYNITAAEYICVYNTADDYVCRYQEVCAACVINLLFY